MTGMINKRGGDALQANVAGQHGGNLGEATSASAGGNAFLDGQSGDSFADTNLDQNVHQRLDQINDGIGGDAGDDNTEANTNINI